MRHTPGNRGDVVKHVALVAALRELARGRHSFSYAESHSGWPSHVLSKPCAERICKLKAIADEEKPPALIAYLELQGEKARYLGSTGIAEKLLDQAASRMSNFIYGKPRVRYINVLKRSTAVSAVGALEATDLRVSSLC
jgi:23S rRNA A2030 N6-methylase RlmJ